MSKLVDHAKLIPSPPEHIYRLRCIFLKAIGIFAGHIHTFNIFLILNSTICGYKMSQPCCLPDL